ncbi:hypothetical protein ABK040_006834 [Willaertia magna]
MFLLKQLFNKSKMSSPNRSVVQLIIVGCGSRGKNYASYALDCPELCKIAAIAEPREKVREYMIRRHKLSSEQVFENWESLVKHLKENNKSVSFLNPNYKTAVCICTQDQYHLEPAIAFANLKIDILLEKPMAINAEDCSKIAKAVEENNVMLAVCHVLRYAIYTQKVKEMIDKGLIGNIITIQHMEPVGYFHYAHSYVRGNWSNEKKSSFMLLAKSCHDIDWIVYMMKPHRCVRVSSFGSLMHCRKENKPLGAASRCLDCPSTIESNCCYSAKKIYLDQVKYGETGWPVSVIVSSGEEPTIENVTETLRNGPYGKCVYESDNDVVDNQVVNLQFDNGATATFTMIAYTKEICERKTRIYGTKGEIELIGSVATHYDFLTNESKKIDFGELIPKKSTSLYGHDYADYYLMKSFIDAVGLNDPSLLLSNAKETLESHLLVFEAEKSRHNGQVIQL